MKKFIVFFMIVATASLSLTAQDINQTSLMYVDGVLLEINDGTPVKLEGSTMLADCTMLDPDGSFLTADGEQLRLKDGECLDTYGIRYRNEYQYIYKMKKENKGLNDSQIEERYQDKFHYVKIGNAVFKIKNISQKPIRESFTFKNGIIVDSFGIYKTASKKDNRLKEGEFFNMSGLKFENLSEYRKMISKRNRNKKSTAL